MATTEARTKQLTGAYADLNKSNMLVGEMAVPSDHVPIVRNGVNSWEDLSTADTMNDYIDLKTQDIVDELTQEIDVAITNAENATNTAITTAENLESTYAPRLQNVEYATIKTDISLKDLAEASKSVIPDVKVSTYSRSSVLSSNAREGQMNVKVSGNTMKNEVVNGNFANGTTGWNVAGSSATLSAVSNTLSATGSGVLATISTYETTSVIPVLNRKYHVKARVRVTNSVATNIKLYLGDNTVGTGIGLVSTITLPTQKQWYDISGQITLTTHSGLLRVYITNDYADATTASGKVMEIKDVICIFMGSDTSNPLYNKTVAEMDALAPYYFDGFSDVKAGVVRTVGKNLLNYKPTNIGAYNTTTGILESSTTVLYTDKINCLPNITYIMSGYSGTVRVLYWSGDTFLSTTTFTSGTITTPTTANKMAFQAIIGVITSLTQIEQNSVSTTYEPYTLTVKYLPYASLKSLPNNTKDYIDGSRYVKNISDVYSLQASDIGLLTTTINVDVVYFPTSKLVGCITQSTIATNQISIDKIGLEVNDSDIDLASNIWRFASNTQYIKIVVPKGTYANLTAAQTAFTGTKVIYQLATPIITEILPNTVKSSPNGSVQYLNIRGEVGYYGTNIAVTNSALPIKSLTSVKKINIADGSEINIDLSTCTIASGGLTFTSTALASGDLVDWNYEFDSALSTTPLIDYEYQNGYNGNVVIGTTTLQIKGGVIIGVVQS